MEQATEGQRVLVGEHSAAFREAVRRVLACNPGLQVVVEASTGTDAIRDAIRLQPDIAILDVHLPDRNGIELARELRGKVPQTRVVLLLDDDGDVYRFAAARQGAACALKDRLVEELPVAIARRGVECVQCLTTEMRGEHQMSTHVKDGMLRVKANASSGTRANGPSAAHALRTAIVILLIGTLLLAFAGWLGSQYQQAAIERSTLVTSDGSSVVVDNLGLLGRPGATLRLSPTEYGSYLQTVSAARRVDLTICLGLGFIGLAVCSLLVGWLEARDAARARESLFVFSPPAGRPVRHPPSDG